MLWHTVMDSTICWPSFLAVWQNPRCLPKHSQTPAWSNPGWGVFCTPGIALIPGRIDVSGAARPNAAPLRAGRSYQKHTDREQGKGGVMTVNGSHDRQEKSRP